jgi:hypothetical protein
MKPTNNLQSDTLSVSSGGKWSILDNLNESKDGYSTRSSSGLSIQDRLATSNYFKLTNRSMSYIFPLVYFFTSSLFLFILLFINVYKDKQTRKNFENLPMNPFPGFATLKELQPKILSASILIISISGFLNVWFFCSLLLQRFSVPELKSNKLTVHLMFILGIFGNIIFIFFGFSPELLDLEISKVKILRISLSMIIFLSFVFFNTLFASLTLMVFENFRKIIAMNDKRLKRNIRLKKGVVYLTVFICFVYISSIFLKYYLHPLNIVSKENEQIKNSTNLGNQSNEKNIYEISIMKMVDSLLFILPYIIFLLNAFINFTYYFDIRYVDDVINMIIDKEFFLTSEESNLLLCDFPI